jgi:hypothetical protein
MADHFIGLNRGQSGLTQSDFAVGATTQSTDVELRVADGASLTKLDVENITKAIHNYVVRYGLVNLLPSGRV